MKETFTRKIGPLPMWGWVAIVGTVIVGWAWRRNRQQSSAAQSSSASGTDASQVPQFVNQTYTTVQPPSAPNPIPDEGPWPRPTTSTSGEGSGPPGVSRVNRSPKVKHQINQIHREHQDYEQDKRPPARTQVHRGRGRGGPARLIRG